MIRELEANRRLAFGLAAATGLLWLFLLLDLSERVDAAHDKERSLARQVQRMQEAASEAEWPRYRDEVNRRLTEFRARAWREESEGLVQARMQDWLQQQLSAVGANQRELAVSLPVPLESAEGVELPSEMRVVRARVVFDFQPAGFNALLETVSSSPQWLWVESLRVRNWGGSPSVELELGALFIIGEGGST